MHVCLLIGIVQVTSKGWKGFGRRGGWTDKKAKTDERIRDQQLFHLIDFVCLFLYCRLKRINLRNQEVHSLIETSLE